ncbi:hypothetical protein BDCR2A_00063 [Borrelia duttonii CR2A]|uniref:Uncharacterized protein n=1 Tax=Borrelia duttonii CR2A TaxID=1432657 RepID=W6THQ7_9SPIR|nr:hypothetical protein BDCR2A_00063 [Borrelia duttonii CR2A]
MFFLFLFICVILSLKDYLEGMFLDLTKNFSSINGKQRESLKTSLINAKNNNFTSSDLVMAA